MTLDADFANILRFPPAGTAGVLRLKVRPATEERIREQLQTALELLRDDDRPVAWRCRTAEPSEFEHD